MRVDLHNHTYLCNHADGSMEEYVQRAIELGIDVFGFSDHAPMGFDPKYRMSMDQTRFYENEVKRLQEKYSDKIKILLAYEVDFLNGFMENSILNADVDYLIGSVHFLNNWGFDNPEFIAEYQHRDIDKIWEDYFKAIEAMAKSRLFDIAGHLDLIKVFKFLPKKDIRSIAQNAVKEIKRSNMVVEVSPAGLRKPIGETYPSKQLLELCYELDIPVTLGSDAHKVEQIGFGYEESLKLIEDIGYKKIATFEKRSMKFIELENV